MRFTVDFACDNAAFDDHPATEIASILRELATRVEDGETYLPIFDANGNRIGRADVVEH